MTKLDKVKKTLVRNPEQPKTVASAPQLPQKTSKAEPAAVTRKTEPDQNPGFDAPEMHSTLQLAKKIDQIVKPSIRLTKSLSEVDKIKLAPDDKVTRRVNFPHDQPVFKNLIPLGEENEIETEPFTATRDLADEIDPEPNFADCSKYKRKQIHYHCEPEIVLNGLDNDKDGNYNNSIDRLKLYNMLLNWESPECESKVLKQSFLNLTQ